MSEDKQWQDVKPKSVQAPSVVPTLYANGVKFAVGFFEVRFTLVETGPQGSIDRLNVLFPPDMLRPLAEGMLDAAANYERQFGKLRQMPRGIQVSAPPQAEEIHVSPPQEPKSQPLRRRPRR